MNSENNYINLVDSIRLLSYDYTYQKQLLPEFADVSEDIVSCFENAFDLLPELIEGGKLEKNAIAGILRLYIYMQWSIRNVGIDTFETGEEWRKLRGLAKEVLSLLKS